MRLIPTINAGVLLTKRFAIIVAQNNQANGAKYRTLRGSLTNSLVVVKTTSTFLIQRRIWLRRRGKNLKAPHGQGICPIVPIWIPASAGMTTIDDRASRIRVHPAG